MGLENWFEFIDGLSLEEKERLVNYLSGYYAFSQKKNAREFQKVTVHFIDGIREKKETPSII